MEPTLTPPCPLCGEPMMASSEQFFVCPKGHGGLVPREARDPRKADREQREFKSKLDRAFGKKTG